MKKEMMQASWYTSVRSWTSRCTSVRSYSNCTQHCAHMYNTCIQTAHEHCHRFLNVNQTRFSLVLDCIQNFKRSVMFNFFVWFCNFVMISKLTSQFLLKSEKPCFVLESFKSKVNFFNLQFLFALLDRPRFRCFAQTQFSRKRKLFKITRRGKMKKTLGCIFRKQAWPKVKSELLHKLSRPYEECSSSMYQKLGIHYKSSAIAI